MLRDWNSKFYSTIRQWRPSDLRERAGFSKAAQIAVAEVNSKLLVLLKIDFTEILLNFLSNKGLQGFKLL